MKIIIVFVLYLSLLFSSQTNKNNSFETVQLHKICDFNNHYWKDKYPYFYKRYTDDIDNIISTCQFLISAIESPSNYNLSKIREDENKLLVQLSTLIRKSRDLALKNKDINLLVSFLKNDLYTIAISKYINKQCSSLNSKYEFDDCLKIINKFANDPNYHNKNLLLMYQKKLSEIKKEIKILDSLKKEECDYNKYTFEELESAKKCLLKKKEELMSLKNLNLSFLKQKYDETNRSIEWKLKTVNSRLNSLQEQKYSSIKLWLSIILSIIMGIIALIVAKKKFGVNLSETVIIEHTKKDKRYKEGYRITGKSKTTKGLQIFSYTVVISFFILYFLLF